MKRCEMMNTIQTKTFASFGVITISPSTAVSMRIGSGTMSPNALDKWTVIGTIAAPLD